ncbi:hypothetical protein [Niveibacterium sp. COAC-50]|uniref:hypothetical protein n=1 Tax=Niveibacterium sp. COAC-50 TaxID=2729384 RepID=UPI0015533B53|nr:hypothetical protein [Niveibacterium sp. COAC-50]
MTPQQIVAIAVRLFAVLCAASSANYFFIVPHQLTSANLGDQLPSALVYGGIYLALALGLWLFPMAVAHKIIPRTNFDNVVLVPGFEAARIGCALIGLWFFWSSLSYVASIVFRAMIVPGSASYFSSLTPEARADVYAVIAQMVFSAALVALSGRIAVYIAGRQVAE